MFPNSLLLDERLNGITALSLRLTGTVLLFFVLIKMTQQFAERRLLWFKSLLMFIVVSSILLAIPAYRLQFGKATGRDYSRAEANFASLTNGLAHLCVGSALFAIYKKKG